jgi:hypothetical protein
VNREEAFKALVEHQPAARVSGPIARYVSSPPRRVPAAGQVLELRPGEVRYVDRAMRIRVAWPRPSISLWYGGDWIWVHAEVLDDDDKLLDVLPLLVSVDAIRDRREGERPPSDQPVAVSDRLSRP